MLLFGAALWGLYWFPLRLLEQAGLHGLWAVVFVYLGASAVQLLVARRQLPSLPRHLRAMLGIGASGAISGIAFSIGMLEGEGPAAVLSRAGVVGLPRPLGAA
jgi:drug/metabolite transporter (DMT)-like permease